MAGNPLSETSKLFSYEAEMSALGSMLLSPRAADEIASLLQPEDFARPAHRLIFIAMGKLLDKGQTIEILTVRDALLLADNLADIGGEDYLLEVASYVPSPANSRFYSDLIKDHSIRRMMSEGSSKLYRLAEGGATPKELRDLCVQLTRQAEGNISGGDAGTVGENLNFTAKIGVMSAFDFINTTTENVFGWANGQMHVICAYRGGGKSAFMIQDATYTAIHNGPVAYVTLADLDREDIGRRIMKNLTGRSSEPQFGHSEWDYWQQCFERVKSLKLHVYDATKMRGGRDIESIAAWIRRKHDQFGIVSFYIDYAQKARTRKTVRGSLERLEEVSDTTQWLAAELDIPGIIGSQLTLGNKENGGLDKTKGGVILEDDGASVVKIRILKEAERLKLEGEYATVPGLTEITFDKNRYGKSTLQCYHQWNSRHARIDGL